MAKTAKGNYASIIGKLNENAKLAKDEELAKRLNESDILDNETDEEDFEDIGDDYYDGEDDFEEGEDVEEAFKSVKAGEVVSNLKAPKKGYKRVNGKYVKMSSQEKFARQKSGKKLSRKAHSSTANRSRTKSMRTRARRLGDSYEIDENVLRKLVNAALEEMYTGMEDRFVVPTVTRVTDAAFNGEDLVVESRVLFDDGVRDTVQFFIEGFNHESGKFSLYEGTELFGKNASVEVEFEMRENMAFPTRIDYSTSMGDTHLSESFAVEED